MPGSTWPSTLPTYPLYDGFEERVPLNTIRTEMEYGPPKVRRRSTAGIRTFALTFALTKSQVASLDTYYVTTLVSGTCQFTGAHPRTGADTSYRFVVPPRYSALSCDIWRASFELEVLP